jgi:hypothetical protein
MSTVTTSPGFRPAAIRLLGWVLFLIVVWFVGRALIEASHEVVWSTLRPKPRWIFAGLCLYLASLGLADITVRHLYGRLGTTLSAPKGFVLYMVPTLGRYVPGKMLSLAGHVAIARRYGVDFSTAAAAIALLTVIGLTAATIAGFFFLIVQPPGIVDERLLRWVLAIGIMLISAALLPGPWLRIVNAGLRLFRRAPLALMPDYSAMLKSLVMMTVHVVLITAGYAAMTSGVIGLQLDNLPIFVGAMCVANVLGFMAVFAPAGIGVREGVLMLLLSPTLGAGSAALFAVTLRLVQVAGDTVTAATGLILLRLDGRSAADQAS